MLNADLGLDVGPRFVADEFEVFIMEVEDRLDIRIDLHEWEWTRTTGKLQPCLVQMVQIEMGIASSVDKVTWFISCHLGHHLQEECIAGNIERNAEEGIGTALIKLQRQTPFLVRILSSRAGIELENGVAGW